MVLTVDGNIPYLAVPREGSAVPTTTRACPASTSNVQAETKEIRRWAGVTLGATNFMGDPESEGGPLLGTVLRRLTLDLHT
eukprot:8957114-Prorocentrum_lima.AAC.1